MRTAALYFHTLRYLKPAQVWARLAHQFGHPAPDLRAAPPPRDRDGRWCAPAARQSSLLSPNRFRFLNEEHTVAGVNDWNSPRRAKLWLYNLHYFDDLNAADARQRADWHRNLIQQWIAENPPGSGVGWDPYPLSLRIVNWVKWAQAGNTLDDGVRHSLAVQVRYLADRLEHHLLGNHLFANAKALVFAGCYFKGEEANGWLRCGINILAGQIPEQILADGGHFERSTMYHALAYEDMLDLSNLAAAFPRAWEPWQALTRNWLSLIGRMGHWLVALSHPDGEIGFFNDAAVGVAPTPSDLFDYARRLGSEVSQLTDGIVWFRESGYIRAQQGRAVMLVDVAPVGPDYQPGHAHADTLSFELSVDGQRVIVNSGTSCYGLGPEREWERSTAAHSTVEIDHQNSSEVWAGFRVARRAAPLGVTVHEKDGTVIIEAAHDGYRRLPGRPIHSRIWRFGKGWLIVFDEIRGRYSTALARYHLHPRIKVTTAGSEGQLSWDRFVVTWRAETGNPIVADSFYAPAFGVRLANSSLDLQATEGRMALALNWN